MEQNRLFQMLDMPQQKNMSDRLFAQISGLIQDGSLPAGYVFPNETVLCQQLNIGRSSIREAYKALELAGYIKRSKRGTVVNDATAILEATPLKNVALHTSSEDFLEFRLMLEEQTAQSAAEKATKKDIDRLNEVMERLVSAREGRDVEELAALDIQFHEGIAAASHNEMIVASMAAVAAAWRLEIEGNFQRSLERDSDILSRMTEQHRQILEAINTRNPELARERMKFHIEDITERSRNA